MPRYTILIVDDELINLESLVDAIRQADINYKVLRANSGEMALKIIKKEIPDVIITDWDMPTMDGIELIKNIKCQPAFVDIPVIMCTGVMLSSHHLKTALEAGANDYIRKPIDAVELQARLNSALRYYNALTSLTKSEEKFKTAFRIASYAKLISKISDGTIIEANSFFYKTTGYSPDEIIGKPSLNLNLWLNPNDRVHAISILENGEVISNLEFQFRKKNGEIFTGLLSAETIMIEGELYFLSSVNDITDRKLAEVELKNSKSQLVEAQKILLETNQQLERKVKERTIELEEKNRLLNSNLQEIKGLKQQLEFENISLKEELISNTKFDEIITNDKVFHLIFKQIEQVAPTDANIFIFGETGTGKELIANAIHKLSKRNKGSFVKINCAAIPENLLESELFGHEKGAFTGAYQRKLGKFELANHGTIFLDEIGEMPVVLQAKLLRVIQQGELERLGGNETIKIDVRIISASNRNIDVEIKKGNFRNDLFFRLNVIPLNLPPLRERKDDIPLLADYFMRKSCRKLNKPVLKIPAKVINQLLNNSWLGNVRELENTIERAVILSQGKTLELINWINEPLSEQNTDFVPLEEYEKQYILQVLEKTNWRIRGENGAAEILDIKPTTLEARMSKLNISRKGN